jgi:hypothetical protein
VNFKLKIRKDIIICNDAMMGDMRVCYNGMDGDLDYGIERRL